MRTIGQRLQLLAAIVGWVGSWLIYGLVLVGPFVGTCTQGGTDNWTGSLILLPLAWIMIGLAMLGWPWARYLRWLAIPHIATLLAGAWVVLPFLWGTTITDKSLCFVRDGNLSTLHVGTLQLLWAPVQLASLVLLAIVLAGIWRAGRSSATHQIE